MIMFSLILYEPEIPPNTGNIIRLCANTGTALHLVHPLGFELDEPRLRRAGLDYRELACVTEHADLQQCLAAVRPRRIFALSTKGKRSVYATKFEPGDAFLLGPETRGLPDDVLAGLGERVTLRIPMRIGNRSLNLSNAAAIVVYEAWRQNGFSGGG
jgi:tRNA (cytidine/uridine-2'-O-)-methyltransferase